MAAAPVRLASVLHFGNRRARQRSSRQKTLFCSCGMAIPVIAGLCSRCYRARAHSRFYFGGYRQAVLHRDGFRCRSCGAEGAGQKRETACPQLHVHHRVPGRSEPDLLITLCAACHARLHRLLALRHWIPEALVPLWQEQHPHTPLQLQFPLADLATAQQSPCRGSPQRACIRLVCRCDLRE
jgi:5-methylcytosine-specific restriction endonuclease McrA